MMAELVIDCRNVLGESAVWDWRNDLLTWVDIEAGAIQTFDPDRGDVNTYRMPERVGAVALRQRGGYVLALASGFAFYNAATRQLQRLGAPADIAGTDRLNDARCDHQGRFWAGAMNEPGTACSAKLYRLDPDLTCHVMREEIATSNGICFGPEGESFYFADSPSRTMWKFVLDPESGELGKGALVTDTYAPSAVPDGSTVDSEGCIWNAVWNDWSVQRLSPDGRLLQRIDLPVQKPTSCALGGPDFRTLYITSAIWDLTPEEHAAQPYAGSLFAIKVDVPGVPEPAFAG